MQFFTISRALRKHFSTHLNKAVVLNDFDISKGIYLKLFNFKSFALFLISDVWLLIGATFQEVDE